MKIIFVCESSHKYESGGRVVRYMAKILKLKGHQVKLIVLSNKRDDYELDSFYLDNDVEFLPINKNLRFRIANIIFKTENIEKYEMILNRFKPDVVHFASFHHSKPARFISLAIKIKAKVILQPWTMHFFCSQGFGFRNNQNCIKCAGGNYLNALFYNCASIKSLPSIIERYFLHKKALEAKTYLSSNKALNKILYKYKVSPNNVFNFPVAFDFSIQKLSDNINNIANLGGEYYIYYGQVNDHKGFNILQEVFKRLPSLKLKVLPINYLNEGTFNSKNIEIVNNINWSNGLREYIINSKAVLIPSLWETTTEFSLCEALLLKKPVVLFNIGVHKDLFVNKKNAMVVEINDINSFVKAIIDLENDGDLCIRLGNNGYETLINHNNVDNLYTKLMLAYSN